jgi:predicted permease
MGQLVRDLKYGARMLRRNPGFSLTVVATLAIGVGLNIAIFSVLYAVVLAPLPYADPNRLVTVMLYNRSLKYPTYCSYPDFLDWQEQSHSFQQIAAYTPLEVDLTRPGTPVHLMGNAVSASFFATLGVKPAFGRDLSPAEDRFGAAPVAVISQRLAIQRFGADASAVGKLLTLDGVDYSIAGVLGQAFRFGEQEADVYFPIGRGDPLQRNNRSIHNIIAIARLAPNVTTAQALAEMNTIQERIGKRNPVSEMGLGSYVEPFHAFFVGRAGTTLFLLTGAVALVLAIACANIAGLLFARLTIRSRELSVRQALGASRSQIVRQLITESLLQSLLGTGAGLAVAWGGLKALSNFLPESLPRAETIALNVPVLLFALTVCLVVGLVFSLVPALQSVKADPQPRLRTLGRGLVGGSVFAQRFLVTGQIALTLLLLAGGGLLLRSVQNLWSASPGFEPQHVLTFQLGMPASLSLSPSATRSAYTELAKRLRAIPGVQGADFTALTPLNQHDNAGPFWIGERPPGSLAQLPRARYYWTGPDYATTMKIPLLRGRYLTPSDVVASERVIVIDTRMANKFFPGQDPVGQYLTVNLWGSARIVGVVGHVRQEQPNGDSDLYDYPEIFASFFQLPDRWLPVFSKDLTVAVRHSQTAGSVLPAIRSAVSSVTENSPIYNIRTMQEVISNSIASQQLATMLLEIFALAALVLVCVGLYGVISYSFNQRIQEFGVRMALGAVNTDILRLVLGQGLKLAMTGVALGAALATVLARELTAFSHLLYGVRATDYRTLLAACGILLLAALLACYVPARRATRLDPLDALRQE